MNWLINEQPPGITLREYFAGQALMGLLANPSVQSWDEQAETPQQLADACALQSVLMADALIAALKDEYHG